MADKADRPSPGSPFRSLLTSRKASFAVLAILAVALAGCNANPEIDPSTQGAPVINTAGRFASSYNPYNPIKYAQTSGFYAGR